MNKKLFSLTIFVLVFSLTLGLGAAGKATAAGSDSYNSIYAQANLFGVDEAVNSAGLVADRDAGPRLPMFDTYGINGSLRN